MSSSNSANDATKMDDPKMPFFDGLLWYLETRNWAFDKINTCPTGSQGLDIKMYHYLYFSNLFGAVDLVRDYISAIGEKAVFEETIKQRFGSTDDYQYARELRNAIVHRGLDPAAAGHAANNVLLILCPSGVQDRTGKKSYSCTFRYTIQLAECCDLIVNKAIYEFLDSHDFLNPNGKTANREETLEAIDKTAVMPDWAKAMARQAFETIDFDQMVATMTTTRIKHVRELLAH